MSAAVAVETEEKLLTFEEFAALPLDHPAELIAGHIVDMSRNNPLHARLVARFSAALSNFVLRAQLGEVFAGDVSVVTKRNPDTGRGADIAYVSKERLAAQPDEAAALVVAPEIIVEVISPSNGWDDVMAKMTEYFAIGVLQVWIVTPSTRTVHVYASLTSMRGYSPETAPILESPAILPGLEVDLREIFTV